MDRAVSKLVVYVAIGLALAYVWVHRGPLVGNFRALVSDWWK
jgi:hypothetical protein